MKTRIALLLLAAGALMCTGQITNVNVGSAPNDRTGDPLRAAFQRLNANDNWLADQIMLEAATRSNQVAMLADQTNLLVGVWLCHTNGLRACYGNNGAAFRSAYAAALPGETIQVDAGFYDFSGGMYWDKPINIVGSGSGAWDRSTSTFSGGTVFQGSFGIASTMTNCLLSSFSLQSSNDIFFWNSWVTNVMNVRVRDVAVGCRGGANYHNAEFSGANIEVDGFRSYNAGANGIVFKGVSNLVARNLYSENDRGNSIYVKGCGVQKGDAVNVSIEGVVVNNSGSILVQGAIPGSGVARDISIRGVTFRGPGACYYLEAQSGCTISNIMLSDSTASGCEYLGVLIPAGRISNVRMDNCQLDRSCYVLPLVLTATPSDPGQVVASNCRIGPATVDQTGQTVVMKANFGLSSDMSAGVHSANVYRTYVADNRIYICWTNTFSIRTTMIRSGDPVRIPSGSLAGVYTNLGVGVSAGTDDPVPGATAGNYYIRLGWTGLGNGAFENVGFGPGKVVARISRTWDYKTQAVHVEGGASSTIVPTFETGMATCITRSDNTGQFIYGTVTAANTPVIMGCCPFLWNSGDHVNVGLFAQGTIVPSWSDSYFQEALVSVKLTGYPACVTAASDW